MRAILAALFLLPCVLTQSLAAQTISDDRYPSWGNRMRGYEKVKEWKWDSRTKVKGARQRAGKHPMRHPLPRSRPRENASPRVFQARTSLAYGFTREVAYAAGLPDNLGSTRPRGVVIGGRPSGCPARFCGCGASLHVFGRIIPSLNLAANWLRFPRTSPASNMVAARRGHVFVLKQHIAGNTWLVHDSNSGGRRTRLHARSIAGYAIVNPHGARV